MSLDESESVEEKPVSGRTRHDGDCTIYAALHNGNPNDGICTCGYGLVLMRSGDESQMYSEERRKGVL